MEQLEAAMVDVLSVSFFGSDQGGEDEELEHQREVLEMKPNGRRGQEEVGRTCPEDRE